MLRKLVEKALALRVAVLGLAAVLAGLGAWSFTNLPIDAFPDISTTQVKIILKAPGMTPEEVESRVIAPIEMEMLGIPQQTMLRSVGKYAIADITIDFKDSRSHDFTSTVNVYYDFDRHWAVKPYLGVGVGGAKFNTEGSNASKYGVALAAMAGFTIDIAPSIKLDTGYRFTWSDAGWSGENSGP